jgi:hypothetical protein
MVTQLVPSHALTVQEPVAVAMESICRIDPAGTIVPSVTAVFVSLILTLAEMLSMPGSPMFSHVWASIAGVAASANTINADLKSVLRKDLRKSEVAIG